MDDPEKTSVITCSINILPSLEAMPMVESTVGFIVT